jgi:vancomycin aglycone glucosyltransferase
MNIAFVINGTRGDVQPMVALATGLISRGHSITICCPRENEVLVTSHHCRFIPFGPSYKEMFRQNAENIKGGQTVSPSVTQIKQDTADQINRLPALIGDAELILGVGFVLGVHTVAEILKIPYRFVIFYPALLGTSSEDKLIYRLLFGFGKLMTNLMMRSFMNRKRIKAGLLPVSDIWKHWMGDEVIVACDREVNTVRQGVGFKFIQTGYPLLPEKNELPGYINTFISMGKPPVYIGFGSNPIIRPQAYQDLFMEVASSTGQRLVISKGWAELPAKSSENVLYVDEVSFSALFPLMSAIVYHGGTGTMAVAARAGIPQAAFPFMADQFENSRQIVRLGIGPQTCEFKKMTVVSLSEAVVACISGKRYKENAMELAEKLKKTDGLFITVGVLEGVIRDEVRGKRNE